MLINIKEVRKKVKNKLYQYPIFESMLKELQDEKNNCKSNIDVLVDGKFIKERKNPEIKFRGSDNQRLLNVKSCLKENKIVELSI